MTTPASVIKDLLVTAGVGVFAASTGWGIFLGKAPDTPNTVLVVTDSGGLTPNPKFLLDFPGVQVLGRGSPGQYQEIYSKMQEVKNALLGLPSQTIGTDRWTSITMRSDISSLGYDPKNRLQMSVNFQIILEPAAGTYRQSL